jgi:hypothetical protein
MKIQYQLLACAILSIVLVNSGSTADCVNCGPKDVTGMPSSGKSMGNLEKVIAKAAQSCGGGKVECMEKYCLKFKQVNENLLEKVFEDMDSGPYSMDDYFKMAECQPEGYSNAIKSPLLHIVADDPNARENFLQETFYYYSKIKKKPAIFTTALNSKNTKGETLLDYIESLKINKINNNPEQLEVMQKIIEYACSHGATYSVHKHKSCKKTI